MGWSIGDFNGRDIGYGVPATCDYPGCGAEIHRGLAFVCGSNAHGGEHGCGLFFCPYHLDYSDNDEMTERLCERCLAPDKDGYVTAFDETPDVPEWINHKLTDESWQRWRDENAEEVAEMRARLEPDVLKFSQ